METNNIKTVEMVRLIRDKQFAQTKDMKALERIEFYRQKAQAFMAQMEVVIEEQRQKKIVV